jgi:hypothetical protein
MTDTGGYWPAATAAQRSTRERALRAYAEAKRRVVGRSLVDARSVARIATEHLDHTARLLRRPR